MQILQKKILPWLYRFVAAILTIALTKLVLQPFQSFLDIQVIALIYLLPVLASTVLWGLTPGVVAGFFAFLVFNYYYIPPYNTLLVHKTQDIITLIIFLFVAVVLSQFIGQAREAVQLAQNRAWEATRMYELISALAGLKDMRSIARELARLTFETFQFDFVEVMVHTAPGESALVIAYPENGAPSTPPAQVLPLLTARSAEGELRLWFDRPPLTLQETRLLDTFTSQCALALERVRLARSENKARILEESDQLKSSLLNSVSHELRTPLSAIKASVSSLRSGAVDWDTAARMDLLAMVEEETDALNLLVGNLLDMSRIESGSLNPMKRWNAIGEIAAGVAAKMRKQLESHRLEMHFPEGLPLVPTDYVMIGQVFTNLISNSIKYASPGTTISMTAQPDGDFLHVKVANQGPQVPEQHLKRIFDKFFRATETEQITGTGLGLSICKGIVEAHGGKIWARNVAQGFEFHFTLPLTLNGSLPDVPREEVDE